MSPGNDACQDHLFMVLLNEPKGKTPLSIISGRHWVSSLLSSRYPALLFVYVQCASLVVNRMTRNVQRRAHSNKRQAAWLRVLSTSIVATKGSTSAPFLLYSLWRASTRQKGYVSLRGSRRPPSDFFFYVQLRIEGRADGRLRMHSWRRKG